MSSRERRIVALQRWKGVYKLLFPCYNVTRLALVRFFYSSGLYVYPPWRVSGIPISFHPLRFIGKLLLKRYAKKSVLEGRCKDAGPFKDSCDGLGGDVGKERAETDE